MPTSDLQRRVARMVIATRLERLALDMNQLTSEVIGCRNNCPVDTGERAMYRHIDRRLAKALAHINSALERCNNE